MTSGSKVVVNSVWVGVGWIIEGLPIRDLMEIERCHHFTKGTPYKQPDEGLKWLHCNGQFGKRVSSNEVRSRP